MERSVLFVCLGNICRSPTGEGIFKSLVESRGFGERILVDSAGTSGEHAGQSADARMRKAASARGYQLTSIARQITQADLARFDLIVAMDRANLRGIQRLDPEQQYTKHIRLFCDFIPGCQLRDVPDPYYGGPGGFEKVLDLIEEGVGPILDHLLNGRSSGVAG
jgi:protein-tyrosine phosphatase